MNRLHVVLAALAMTFVGGCAGVPTCGAGDPRQMVTRVLVEKGFDARIDQDGVVAVRDKGAEVFVGPLEEVGGTDILFSMFVIVGVYEPEQRARLMEVAHDITRREFGVKSSVHVAPRGSLVAHVSFQGVAPCGRLGDYLPLGIQRVGDSRQKFIDLAKDIPAR